MEIKRTRTGAIVPERVSGRVWKFFCPDDFSGIVLPTCDLLVPTGWDIGELTEEYLPCSYLGQTYPSADPEVEWNGGNKLLLMSPWVHKRELYIHIINLGNTELRVRSGKPIAYICFTKISWFSEYDGDLEKLCFTG